MRNPYTSPDDAALPHARPQQPDFVILFLMAVCVLSTIACIALSIRDVALIERDKQFIELMHEAERHQSIDFRLHRLDVDLLRD